MLFISNFEHFKNKVSSSRILNWNSVPLKILSKNFKLEFKFSNLILSHPTLIFFKNKVKTRNSGRQKIEFFLTFQKTVTRDENGRKKLLDTTSSPSRDTQTLNKKFIQKCRQRLTPVQKTCLVLKGDKARWERTKKRWYTVTKSSPSSSSSSHQTL